GLELMFAVGTPHARYRLSCSMLGRMRASQLQLGCPAPYWPTHAPGPPLEGKNLVVPTYWWTARAICFRLFWHDERAEAARTFCTAGSSRPISTAMMAITTSSSISVNADLRPRTLMVRPPK